MPTKALRNAINNRMATNWTGTPISYANVPFEPPANAPWVRLTLITADSSPLGVNGADIRARDSGYIAGQVFVPAGTATAAGDDLADAFAALYEHTRFDGIVTYTATVRTIGVRDGWHQTNVSIPFRRNRNV